MGKKFAEPFFCSSRSRNVTRTWPVATSQIRRSEATVLPSGENATWRTGFRGSMRGRLRISRRSAMLQSANLPPRLAAHEQGLTVGGDGHRVRRIGQNGRSRPARDPRRCPSAGWFRPGRP